MSAGGPVWHFKFNPRKIDLMIHHSRFFLIDCDKTEKEE